MELETQQYRKHQWLSDSFSIETPVSDSFPIESYFLSMRDYSKIEMEAIFLSMLPS